MLLDEDSPQRARRFTEEKYLNAFPEFFRGKRFFIPCGVGTVLQKDGTACSWWRAKKIHECLSSVHLRVLCGEKQNPALTAAGGH